MKSFTVIALLSTALSVFAGVFSETPSLEDSFAASKPVFISADGNVTVIEKRAGNEIKECYNVGTKINRAPVIAFIDNFCSNINGLYLSEYGQVLQQSYTYGRYEVLLYVKALNGCKFSIDGNCNRLLRIPLDQCNTDGENGKQGGTVTDSCAFWRFDAGYDGSLY